MRALCSIVAFRVDAAGGQARLPRGLERHVTSCLRCQADRARARRTNRELAVLASRTAPAPSGFGARVAAAIDGEGLRPIPPTASGGHRGAAAVTGVAMLAAGGAAIAAWRLVRRPA